MDTSEYGLWLLAFVNAAVFIIFAFSFFKPASPRDWRSFSAFSAFIIALFVEMYGFPLTIFLFSGWLQSTYPGTDWFAHDSGHLLEMMFGWKASPHFGPFHLLSFIFIGGGFILLSAAWRILFQAQTEGVLATTGPYAYVRHPQYVGFVLIMIGFLLQWPTLLTVAMFPVLIFMYYKLSLHEENEVTSSLRETYQAYASRVPRFFPHIQSVLKSGSSQIDP